MISIVLDEMCQEKVKKVPFFNAKAHFVISIILPPIENVPTKNISLSQNHSVLILKILQNIAHKLAASLLQVAAQIFSLWGNSLSISFVNQCLLKVDTFENLVIILN